VTVNSTRVIRLVRRQKTGQALAMSACSVLSAAASDAGRRFEPERQVVVDRTTGALLTALTTAKADDEKIYQTHPQWAADGVHVIFGSRGRSADGRPQLFAVDEITGAIVQLTDGPGVRVRPDSLYVARRSNKLYYLREVDARTHLIELDLDALLSGNGRGVAERAGAGRVISVLPPEYRAAGRFSDRPRGSRPRPEERLARLAARGLFEQDAEVGDGLVGVEGAPTARSSTPRSALGTSRRIPGWLARSSIATSPVAMPRSACGSFAPTARATGRCFRSSQAMW
jgi:hypothetical protein